MALQISETWESGAGSIGQNASDELSAHVWGDPVADNADDPATVTNFAGPRFPAISALGNIVSGIARKRIGVGRWLFTASYKSSTATRQTGEAKFAFKGGSSQAKIFTARKHIGDYAPEGKTAPSYQGAINVTKDGVEGVDVDIEAFAFDVTFYVDLRNMTSDYCGLLKSSAKHVNLDTVNLNIDGIQLTFQPGELRLVDYNGEKRIGFGDLELCLSFAAIANQTSVVIGGTADDSGTVTGGITIPALKGWDYLWFSFETTVDESANPQASVKRVTSAHLEEVYLYTNLSPIFGTGSGPPDTSEGGATWFAGGTGDAITNEEG